MRGRTLAWAVVAIASLPGGARAAYLMCQAELKKPDCSERTGALGAGEQLLLGASCQECTGGGSDLKCTPDEKVTATGLAIETTASAPVAGSFSQTGTCDFGLLLFKHSAGLSPGSYRVVVNVPGFAKTELLTFTVGGTPPPGDGGKPSPREAGQPVGDGGGSVPGRDGGGSAGDGKVGTGDGGMPGNSGSSDGGCSCSLASPPAHPAALLVLVLLCCLVRRRL